MRIVLDTNVLVSGLLTPHGTCGDVVRLLATDRVVLCVDARLLIEYEEVLRRPRFRIDPRQVGVLLDSIFASAETHASTPLPLALPDANDAPFLEVALASGADCLVTGNVKHFPARCRSGLRVLSPAEFLVVAKRPGLG